MQCWKGRGGSSTEKDKALGSMGNQSTIHGTHKHALKVCICPQRMCWLTWVCHQIIGRGEGAMRYETCHLLLCHCNFLRLLPVGVPKLSISGQSPPPVHVAVTPRGAACSNSRPRPGAKTFGGLEGGEGRGEGGVGGSAGQPPGSLEGGQWVPQHNTSK